MVQFASIRPITAEYILTEDRQTVEDFSVGFFHSWRFRALAMLAIISLAIYQWNTEQLSKTVWLWPHITMAFLVWMPDVYARGTINT